VFVRPVMMTEGRRLQRIGRTAKDPVKLRRAIVVLMPAQGQSAPDWQGEMIAAYMRWRNARAQPKRNFAPNSCLYLPSHWPRRVPARLPSVAL
jgi:hypothetical protein